MKNIKYSFIGMVLVAMGLGGCQDKYDAPDLQIPEASMTPNMTIAQFKEYIQENIGDSGSDGFLIPKNEDGDDIVIHGRVVSCDASGNIYQNLCIQDETGAITFSVRQGNMWSYYRVGQDIVFNATGVYGGTYNNLYQLGWLDSYNDAPSMTFMSWDIFRQHTELNGLPESTIQYVSPNGILTGQWPSDKPYCVVFNSIKDITDISPATTTTATQVGGLSIMSQLVEIQNVRFEDGGVEPFAPYQETVNRYIVDSSGAKIIVRNSGYSNFYSTMLPEGTGTIRGILSLFGSDWQLLLRDIDDVMFEGMPGDSKESALTVGEAISQENNGRNLWTKGYIVGSVKGGVDKVTSNDDIIFGKDADLPTNIVIAATPEVTNWEECIAIQLPAGSALRKYANLADNPQVLGELLYVKGMLTPYLGMHGLTGDITEFEFESYVIEDNEGAGTQGSPYTVGYILDNPSEKSNIWVEGYIVGYVDGTDFASGATFSLPGADANYNGANVIISASPTGATIYNSIPVSCNRTTVGLKNNPANFGKKVKFYGNSGSFMGAFGMSLTTDAIIQ